ncbi:MAG: DUF547 domain-containing protein [Owenweeksia sp.]
MKLITIILTILCFFTSQAQSNEFSFFLEKCDRFFETYVEDGSVNYSRIAAEPQEINALYHIIGTLQVKRSELENYQAFWINAYNLAVIKGISEAYSVKSPMDIDGFFDQKKFRVAGEDLTLNQIENEKLRAGFEDARFHFVLVCGAVSCPPIVPFAYTPADLNTLLELQTIKALNNPEFIRIDHEQREISISEIFKWYREDFMKNHKSLIAFINTYRDDKIPEDYRVGYYTYNWALNDVSGSGKPIQGGSVIQTYTPSKLLKTGQWDLKNFNNFYSETKGKFNGEEFEKPRENFFTSTFEAFYGASKNARFNLGLIVNLKSTTKSNDSVSKGFFSPIAFQNQTGISRSGIGSIAPSIRFVPFKKIANFSMQTSFFIPLLEEESAEGVFLDRKSYLWDTRFFFDKGFWNQQFQIFTEVDLQYFFGDKNAGFANNSLGVPVSAFLSYFPADWFTVYGQLQRYFLIDLGNEFSQEFTQLGSGMKFQLNPVLNLEVSYTSFISGRDSGLGQTINLGLRALF